MATAPPKRRFVGRTADSTTSTSTSNGPAPSSINAVPPEIQNDALINAAIDALLPKNYGFEVHKSIWQIRKYKIQRVALQMPEGLSMYACALADLVERFTDAEAVILADVTYGACCVDDYTAKALGCDMLIHYGHSCLIPIDTTTIRCLYVFVEIGVDTLHLRDTVRLNFPACLPSTSAIPRGSSSFSSSKADGAPSLAIEADDSSATSGQSEEKEQEVQTCHLAVVGTVQFLAAVHGLKKDLESLSEDDILSMPLALPSPDSSTTSISPPSPPKKVRYRITIPQVKPLSPGEILGCTAPRLPLDAGIQGLLYIGDGRFHLESIMIANPWLENRTYRYDPYEKKMTKEGYDHEAMRALRKESVQKAEKCIPKKMLQAQESETSNNWAVILGTLGRQGSLSVLSSITSHLPLISTIPILLSELSPIKLSILQNVQVFVQTSCPRLSIDWGYAFTKPLLSPYEANVALGKAKADWMVSSAPSSVQKNENLGEYPMDFYADESGGKWTPRYHVGVKERERKERMAQRAKEREEKARLASLQQQHQQPQVVSASA